MSEIKKALDAGCYYAEDGKHGRPFTQPVMCNQVKDKECYNQDGEKCKVCEYQSLCLCTRPDRPVWREK